MKFRKAHFGQIVLLVLIIQLYGNGISTVSAAPSITITSSVSGWSPAGTYTMSWQSSGVSGSNYRVKANIAGYNYYGGLTDSFSRSLPEGGHYLKVYLQKSTTVCLPDIFGGLVCTTSWENIASDTEYYEIGVVEWLAEVFAPPIKLPNKDIDNGNGLFALSWENKLIQSSSYYSRIEYTYVYYDEDTVAGAADLWYDLDRISDWGGIADLETIQVLIDHSGNIAQINFWNIHDGNTNLWSIPKHEDATRSGPGAGQGPDTYWINTWNHAFGDDMSSSNIWSDGYTIYHPLNGNVDFVKGDRIDAEYQYRYSSSAHWEYTYADRYNCPVTYCP